MAYAEPVLAALDRLQMVGVEEGNITVVSVVIARDAAEKITEEAGDMSVVSRAGTLAMRHIMMQLAYLGGCRACFDVGDSNLGVYSDNSRHVSLVRWPSCFHWSADERGL